MIVIVWNLFSICSIILSMFSLHSFIFFFS